MRTIETTITVDVDGAVRVDQPVAIAPGRHRAVLVIDETDEPVEQESWPDFIERMYGSLADVDLLRYPQGDYERREAIE